MKKISLLLLSALLFAGGCTTDAPTAPEQEPEISAPTVFRGTAEEVSEYVLVLNDITERLLPSLIDQSFAVQLTAAINELANALSARDGERSRVALVAAFGLLDSYEAAHGADSPDSADLAGVYLNLWYADYLIGDE